MERVHLHHVFDYTDVDRAFWAEHLEGWVPWRIVDAHAHVVNPALRLRPMTEEMRRQYWVNEVSEPIAAPDAERCDRITFPGRTVDRVNLGSVSLDFDIEGCNEYVRVESLKRPGWRSVASVRPEWPAERAEEELAKPGVLGFKPYYALLGYDDSTRDKYIEASIFEMLPHRILEVMDQRRAWLTLHVPKAGRLAHPDNIREVRELRRRYPNIITVIAHLGRSYTLPHAEEALPPLAEDAGLFFDNSAVLNPAVHRLALRLLGPRRILFGTDNPVFYMRGRRQWHGRTYVNRTSYPFFFNKEREAPEIEAGYTLFMYEALKGLKEACEEAGVSRQGVEDIFFGNADRLIEAANSGRRGT